MFPKEGTFVKRKIKNIDGGSGDTFIFKIKEYYDSDFKRKIGVKYCFAEVISLNNEKVNNEIKIIPIYSESYRLKNKHLKDKYYTDGEIFAELI